MSRLAVLLLGAWFPLMLSAQEPAYYVRNSRTGELTAVQHGDPAAVHPDHWAIYYYRKGSRRGNTDRSWGMRTEANLDVLLRGHRADQRFEISYCNSMRQQAPCFDDTFFNSLGPVAVVDPPASKTEAYPSAAETQRGILSRLVVNWGEQLRRVRNKLIELERHRLTASENPREVGSATREYAELLKDAENQYYSVRDLLNKANSGRIPSDAEVENHKERFEADISRLSAIQIAAVSNAQAQSQRSDPVQDQSPTGRPSSVNRDEREAAAEPLAPANVQLQRLVRHLLMRDSAGETQTPRAAEVDTTGKSIVEQFLGDETFNRAGSEFNRGQVLTMAAARNRNCSTARDGESTLAKAEADYGAVTGVNEGTASMQLTLVRSYLTIARRQVQMNCR